MFGGVIPFGTPGRARDNDASAGTLPYLRGSGPPKSAAGSLASEPMIVRVASPSLAWFGHPFSPGQLPIRHHLSCDFRRLQQRASIPSTPTRTFWPEENQNLLFRRSPSSESSTRNSGHRLEGLPRGNHTPNVQFIPFPTVSCASVFT